MEAINETPLSEVRNKTTELDEIKAISMAQLEATATLIENVDRDRVNTFEILATILELQLENAGAR